MVSYDSANTNNFLNQKAVRWGCPPHAVNLKEALIKMSGKKSSKKAANPRGFFVFFGLCLVAITGGILWFNGRVNTLECQRLESSQINCTVQTRWLGVLPLEQQTVQQLQGASVNRNCYKDRNSNCI